MAAPAHALKAMFAPIARRPRNNPLAPKAAAAPTAISPALNTGAHASPATPKSLGSCDHGSTSGVWTSAAMRFVK
jgi:hypothetical protein